MGDIQQSPPWFQAKQFSFGFFAVGQVAVGVFAVGQVAIGLFALGINLVIGGVAGGGNVAISAFVGAAANVVISLFSLAVVNVGISVIGCKWTVQVCLTELSPWTGFAYVGVMFIVGTLFLKFGEFPFSNVTLWSFIRRHFDKGLSEPEETQRLIQTNSAHKDTATELLKCRVRAYKPSPTPNGETAGILEVIVEDGAELTLPVLKEVISKARAEGVAIIGNSTRTLALQHRPSESTLVVVQLTPDESMESTDVQYYGPPEALFRSKKAVIWLIGLTFIVGGIIGAVLTVVAGTGGFEPFGRPPEEPNES